MNESFEDLNKRRINFNPYHGYEGLDLISDTLKDIKLSEAKAIDEHYKLKMQVISDNNTTP